MYNADSEVRMRFLNLILIATMSSMLASCSAKNDPSPGSSQVVSEPKALSTVQREREPAPPKDAQWTIYCLSVSGINHVAQTNQLKADLMRTTSLRGWYVVHQEDHSVLYYGYYRTFKD